MLKKSGFILMLFTSHIMLCSKNSIYSDSLKLKNIKKNSLYLELLGNAGLFSVNYDRLFYRTHTGRINLSGRIGGGFQTVQHDSLISYRIPLELNMFFGANNNNHLEFGIGYTPFIYRSLKNVNVPNEFKNYYLFVLRTGYRYQVLNNKENKKILPFGRVAIEGLIYQDYKTKAIQIRPFISLCIGFSFGIEKNKDWYYE